MISFVPLPYLLLERALAVCADSGLLPPVHDDLLLVQLFDCQVSRYYYL